MKFNLKNGAGRALLRKLLFVLLGNLCYSLALNLFLRENAISAGGFSGLAIALNKYIPIPVGTFVFVITIPLFVWSVFVKGWSFMLVGLVGTALYSLEVDFGALFLPCITHDLLLAAICGGVLNGVAAICFLEAGSNAGGTDLLARLLLTRHKDLSLGKMFLICDGVAVLASMVAYQDLELGIYGIIGIVVASFVNDRLIEGMNRAVICFIIPSGEAQPLANEVMQGLRRGVTALKGVGMYAKTERDVLMTVVKPRQAYRVKALVKRIDPGAFVFTAHAAEVMGKGFIDVDASATKNENEG